MKQPATLLPRWLTYAAYFFGCLLFLTSCMSKQAEQTSEEYGQAEETADSVAFYRQSDDPNGSGAAPGEELPEAPVAEPISPAPKKPTGGTSGEVTVRQKPRPSGIIESRPTESITTPKQEAPRLRNIPRPSITTIPRPGAVNMRTPSGPKQAPSSVQGEILYTVPEEMEVGKVYRVELSVTVSVEQSEVLTEVRTFSANPETVVRDTIQLGDRMRAEIIDPYGQSDPRFSITPLGKSEKPVSLAADKFTLWQWDVVPLQGGQHPLRLKVVIVADGDDIDFIPAYDKEVNVSITFGRAVAMFVENNWQWLISTLLLPMFIWWYRKWQSDPRQQQPEE